MAGNRIKGITIEIGGDTTKLDKALSGTNKEIKTTQANLKDVERLLKLDPENVELLDQKQRLLAQATELTSDKFTQLKKVAEESTVSNVKYREWQESFTVLQRQITMTTTELSSLEAEGKKLADIGFAPDSAPMVEVQEKTEALKKKLEELNQTVTNTYEELGRPISIEQWDGLQREMAATAAELAKLEDAANDAADGLAEIEVGSDSASGSLGGLSGVAVGAALSIGSKLVDAAIEAVKWMWSLDEATEDYRVAMGKLNTAFEAAGFSTDTAKKAYEAFYKILGDTDTAAEASQLLAQLADNEEDAAEWTRIAAGVYGTFGDALPINGLIEAANETAKVGKVTGVLADALNWVGISEDKFNEILENTNSEGERAWTIMNELSMAYDEARDAFHRNNETMIESREVQLQLDEAQAELGESVAKLKNGLYDLFGPFIIGSIQAATGFVQGLGIMVEWVGQKVQDLIGFFRELTGASSQTASVPSSGSGRSNTRSMAAPYSLEAATAENLPHLAQGTVTRPNNPFLAVVGDNPNEPEIIAPYSAIKQATQDAMAERGNMSSSPRSVNVTLVLNGAVLGRAVAPLVDNYNSARGVDLVVQ